MAAGVNTSPVRDDSSDCPNFSCTQFCHAVQILRIVMATDARELDYRPSYIAAAIVSLAVLVLYLVTLAPNTAMWDTSEYIAAAYTLGLPHPPGNPLFVLIGRVFSIIPIAGAIALRSNILAPLCRAV